MWLVGKLVTSSLSSLFCLAASASPSSSVPRESSFIDEQGGSPFIVLVLFSVTGSSSNISSCIVRGGQGDMVDPVLHESAGDLVPSEGNGNKGGDIKCSGLGAGTGFTAAVITNCIRDG